MQWPINGRVSHVVNVLFNSPHAPAPIHVCLSVKIKYITCPLSWSKVKEIYDETTVKTFVLFSDLKYNNNFSKKTKTY